MAQLTVTRVNAPRSQVRVQAHRDAVEMGFMIVAPVYDEGVIAVHTEVHQAGRGQGVGQALFEHLVEWAQSERRYVVPACPFVLSRFEKDSETADVRATCRLREGF
jgi:hypothetical protein